MYEEHIILKILLFSDGTELEAKTNPLSCHRRAIWSARNAGSWLVNLNTVVRTVCELIVYV